MKEDNNKIPIVDIDEADSKEKIGFLLWSQHSSSDYRNDRERPYNGQPHTTQGIRGKQEISGLTMRDIVDCFIQALLSSADPFAPNQSHLPKKVFEIDPEFKGTKYAKKGNWITQDIYEVDLSKVDPYAIAQNLTCFIEAYMGIYPNVNLDGIPKVEEVIKELTEGEPNQ